MKQTGTIYALALALFLGAAALGTLVAQEDKPRDNAQEQEAKPEKPEKQETPKAEKQENPKPEKQDKNASKEGKNEDKANSPSSQPESRSSEAGSARVQGGAAHGGQLAGKGGHIPDEKFRASFGKSHTFVINRPVVVNNQTTFQSGGYTFVLVDPWPVGWAYTDQCYIDYIDGEYFLFDLLHPGVRIALFVEM
jgi:hypothetical protein